MKANAPEKIYLEKVYPDNGVLPNGLNYNQSQNDIEYVRTDAFIEKAEKYLNQRLFKYISYCQRGVGVSTEEFIEDFIKTIRQ